MKDLFKLFWAFFKIGLFTIGGGYAMLPLMQREAVDNNGWVTDEEMLDIYTLSQCTPGVIAVNTATFIGRKVKGFFGALFATLGAVTPSLIIISLIALFFTSFAENQYVIYAFDGIRCAVAALMIFSIIKMVKKNEIKSALQIGILLAAFALITFLHLSPIFVILVAALFGFFFDTRGRQVIEDA